MADSQNYGGLSDQMDVSTVNPYGQNDQRLQELRDAQKEAIEALQHRYDQPNWWKVAAGFAKPQLGGFLASAGSAAEAAGETEEQRRNQAPTVAQMKIQLARTNMVLDQKKQAAAIVGKAQSEGRQLTPAELEEISNLDPERGKMLMQGQDTRAKTVANNTAITTANYKAMGLPPPVLNEMGLPETGQYPTGGTGGKTLPPPVVNTVQAVPAASAVDKTHPTTGINANDIDKIESNHNPDAIGPNVKGQGTAKGSMQVMDATATDPGFGVTPAHLTGDKDHDKAELARVGKDYHAALVKHYGDDTLGTAAYNWGPKNLDKWIASGADISKLPPDVKDYIGKAYMAHAISNKKDSQVQSNVQPTQPPAQKEVLHSNYANQSVYNPYTNVQAGELDTQKTLQGEGKTYRENLTTLGSPEVYNQHIQPINSLEAEAKDPRFDKVMGILAGHGLVSGLAEFIQQGVNLNAGDFNANLSVPLSKIAIAMKDNPDREFAQDVYRNLAQMALNNQKSAGISPSTARNAELGILSEASAHPETLPNAARFYIRQSNLLQRMNKDLWQDHTKLLQGNHDYYVLDPNSPVKLWDAKNAKSQQQIIDEYNKAIDKERNKFLHPAGAK
jgi:Transglycosylase SLT domain